MFAINIEKIKNPKISYILKKHQVSLLFTVSVVMKKKKKKKVKVEESIEKLTILGLITNKKRVSENI